MIAALVLWSALAANPKIPTGEPQAPQGPNPFLAQAKENYRNLEFERCLQRLQQAPQWRSSPQELLDIELYAGMCSYNLNQLPVAEEHFRLALRIQPTAELPAYTSPKLVDFFKRIKKTMPKVQEKPPEKPAEKPVEADKPDKPDKNEKPDKADKNEKAEAAPEKPAEKPAEIVESPPDETKPAEKPVEVADDRPVREEPPKLTPEPKPVAPVQVEEPFFKRRAGPIAVGGVAVVAVAVGAGLGANAKSLQSKANGAQYDSDFHQLGSQAKSSATGANVAFAVAAVAAIGAVLWYLFGG
ncbi:MAG: hypothetical protein QM723_20690 [Myxococcaceae bacterium]